MKTKIKIYFVIISSLFLSACMPPNINLNSEINNKNRPQKNVSNADKKYQELVKFVKEKEGDISVDDVNAIRDYYVETSFYQPYISIPSLLVQATFSLIKDKKWKACIKNSKLILNYQYMNINGHYLAMLCNEKMGNKEQKIKHQKMISAIIDAIWSTGDGKTKQSAFYTYSTPELQAFLQLQGLQIMAQSLVNEKTKIYDLMKVKDPKSKKEFSLYFNITKQWQKGFNKTRIASPNIKHHEQKQ